MTEKTQPTDAEILDAADDFRSQYKHGGTTFDEFDALDFARAVLAKWGQPAHSGVPVAFIYWPINGPPRLAWYSQKVLNDAILKTYEGHQPDVKLYTAPQPVEREPLTHAQAKALVSKYGNDPLHLVYQVEVAHGIKIGGQNGAE